MTCCRFAVLPICWHRHSFINLEQTISFFYVKKVNISEINFNFSIIIWGKKRFNENKFNFLKSYHVMLCSELINFLWSFNCLGDVLFFFTLFHSSGLAILRICWDLICVGNCIQLVGLCYNILLCTTMWVLFCRSPTYVYSNCSALQTSATEGVIMSLLIVTHMKTLI